MLELDEKYRDYLDDTSVYYEMYAKGISTDTIVDINNYKSTQYFSENNKVSFGFFGMATCEFEIEEKSLTENEHVQIMAVTPDYKEAEEFEDTYYVGNKFGEDEEEIINLIKKIRWTTNSSYSAILFSASKLTEEDAYYIYHIGVGDNYIYPTKIELDYWNTINFESNAFGVIMQRTKIEKVLEDDKYSWQISGYYKWNAGTTFTPVAPGASEAYFFADLTYIGQGSEEILINGHLENYPKEFPVFTGFVDKLEENNGTYKVTCNDVSQIFDTHLTGNDVPKLVRLKKYKDVLNYFMNDYVKTWRMKKNTNNADEYGNEDYEEITGGYDRFYLPVKMYGATQREIIANICGQIGANAYVNNVGELVIKSYQYNFAIPTNESILYEDGLKINYSVSNVANKWNFILSLSDTENPETYTFQRESNLSGNEVNIYFKNITKQAFNLSTYEVFKRFMKSSMCYAEDGTAEFVGNFVYEVGDMIILYDSNYNSHILVISRLEHQCDGGLITKISSFIKNTSTSSTSKDANTSYSGSSSSVQNMESIINLQKQITSVNEELTDFKKNAVQSVKLNGTELKSGTTATIPIASSTQDGALSKELYEEINSEITEEQIDEWFGMELDLGVNVFGNYSNNIQTETLLTTAIVGTEVTDA